MTSVTWLPKITASNFPLYLFKPCVHKEILICYSNLLLETGLSYFNFKNCESKLS